MSNFEVHEPTGVADSEKMKAQNEKRPKLEWSFTLGVWGKNCEIPLSGFLCLSDCDRNFRTRFFEGACSINQSPGKRKSTFDDFPYFFPHTSDDTKTRFEGRRSALLLSFSLSAAQVPWQVLGKFEEHQVERLSWTTPHPIVLKCFELLLTESTCQWVN